MDRVNAVRVVVGCALKGCAIKGCANLARGGALVLVWAGLAACDVYEHTEHEAAPLATDKATASAETDAHAPPEHSALLRQSPVPQRSMARFVPSEHGFAFVNRFSGSPLPSATLTRLWGGRMDYGLCGGMSFAAADYFLANAPIPGATTPPAEGSVLYLDLQRRQLESLGIALAGSLRFMAWMAMSDRAVGDLTIGQLSGIMAALDRGEPVVLGLVYHSFDQTLAVWHNHQVLAVGVGERAPGRVALRVYDPNYPGNDDVQIVVRSVDGSPLAGGPMIACARLVPGRRPRAIRGVFSMPYRFVPPPNRRGERHTD